MKKIKRRTQRNILIGICAGAVLLAAVLLIQGIRRITADRADTSEGVEYIKNVESEDVAAVEEKISRLESQEGADTAEKSIKERFSNAVVLGDSIAAGFSEYDILNASSVIAESDARLGHPESLIERAKAMSPQILFLSLDIRDVTAEDGGIDAFTEQYGTFLDTLQEELPNAHIFVNSIFPVQEKALESEPELGQTEQYNNALEELCDSRRVGFIDNTDIVEDQYYEEDGIHFQMSFYTVWAEHMAEVAAL